MSSSFFQYVTTGQSKQHKWRSLMNTAKASAVSRELEWKGLLERIILQSWTLVPM